jgi:hypothetical protein
VVGSGGSSDERGESRGENTEREKTEGKRRERWQGKGEGGGKEFGSWREKGIRRIVVR